jgi:hypothetical protein
MWLSNGDTPRPIDFLGGRSGRARGGGEHVDSRNQNLNQYQCCAGGIDVDRSSAPRRSPQGAKEQESDCQGKNDQRNCT